MAKKKTHFDYHKDWNITDEQGVVIKQGVVTKTCKTTEEFVKVYLNAIDEMMNLDHRLFQTLMVCFKTCTFCDDDNKEGSIVTNNSIFKELCREAIGKDKNGKPLSDDAVNNYISRLAKMNILQRYKCRGMYIINPTLFIKGHIPQEVRIKAPQNVEPNNNFDSSTNTPC